MFHCSDYVGCHCVYGDCPNALYHEYPWIVDYYENCVGCSYDFGCSDCLVPDILSISIVECLIKRFYLEGGYIWI